MCALISCFLTYTPANPIAYTFARSQLTRIHARTHARTRTHTRTHAHTHAHPHTHTHTLTHTHTHTPFSEIQSLISDLSKNNLLFYPICFQETWLHTNYDLGIFHLPAYNSIHKCKICCGHGGLVIYLNNHTLRSDLSKDSTIWEGLFIDIAGENIINKITLGNIYKPPKYNSNNQNISCFIDEITLSLHTLSKENSYSILVGHFNIDLLKFNERQIFSKLFDNMCSSGFFPHITVPTRFVTNSCSLIDQTYIKKIHQDISNNKTSSGVVISNISDHLPCFTSICISQTTTTPPKFITVNQRSETAINNFKEGLKATFLHSHLNTDSH